MWKNLKINNGDKIYWDNNFLKKLGLNSQKYSPGEICKKIYSISNYKDGWVILTDQLLNWLLLLLLAFLWLDKYLL